MARGNDGNLLQHAVELGVVDAMLSLPAVEALRLTCTHAMAPFEALKDPTTDASSTRLRGRLALSGSDIDDCNLPLLIRAYRHLGATERRYPNTAMLVQWLAGSRQAALGGTLCEKEVALADELRRALPNFEVQTNWRDLPDFGCAGQGHQAWLVTMDPYKFTRGTHDNEGVIDASDVADIACKVGPCISSGAVGALLVFVYGMYAPERRAFFEAVFNVILCLLSTHEAS
jgi:hypothetical protein